MPTNLPSNQLQVTNNTTVAFAVVDSVSQSPDASASQQLVQVLKLPQLRPPTLLPKM